MRYILIFLLSIFLKITTYSQDVYAFDQASIYDRIDFVNKKQWKWVQFHNQNSNDYQASVHVQKDDKYSLNLTFTDKKVHYRSIVNNYHFIDGFIYLINKSDIHRYNNGYREMSKNYKAIIEKKDNLITLTLEPINKKKARRKDYSTIYYEIDTSVPNTINFISEMARKSLFQKYGKEVKGIITKKCYRDSKGIFTSCIKLVETRDIKTSIVAK